MILKSYIVEQDIGILRNYAATLIYGENVGIQDDLKEEIKIQNKNIEIITFFENDILKSDLLLENIINVSLFDSKKIIFILCATDKIFDKITESLEKTNEDVKIYIFSGNLEKKAKLRNYFEKDKKLAIFACYNDNERTLINYVNKELNGLKGLSGEITNLIIYNSNMDRKTIKTECNKIKNYFVDKKIAKQQILELLNIKNDTEFEEVRDKALMGERLKVNKLLSETEILNDEAFFYLNSLNYRITRLYEIVKLDEKNNNFDRTMENLKPPIFWKDKPIFIQQLKKWGKKKLEESIGKIAEAEILMKRNSYIRNDIIIKNLILDITEKASTSD